ncbi:hypothetical protein LEP1GSC126_1328 [Leptospira kirschneri str. 200801774]|nr:hypothetical protein LEP1GSC126_1328 [Leptospira kirschneri str. 200801774]
MPILREAFAEFSGSLWKLSKTLFTKALETQQNAFLRKRWKLNKTLFTKAF